MRSAEFAANSDCISVGVPIIHIKFLIAKHTMKTQIRACPVSLTENSSVCTDPQKSSQNKWRNIYCSTSGCRQREPRHDADLHGGRVRSPRLIQNCSGNACILSSLSAPPLATRPASSQAAHSTCNRAQHLFGKAVSIIATASMLTAACCPCMHACMVRHGELHVTQCTKIKSEYDGTHFRNHRNTAGRMWKCQLWPAHAHPRGGRGKGGGGGVDLFGVAAQHMQGHRSAQVPQPQ